MTTEPGTALVLACMDHRLIDAVGRGMAVRGLAGRYDLITIAGGAMGVIEGGEAWTETFWSHLALARRLHAIDRVILIDHRDCGACKALHGESCADDRDRETAIHSKALGRLAAQIAEREPGLAIEALLMDVDGRTSAVPLNDGEAPSATASSSKKPQVA